MDIMPNENMTEMGTKANTHGGSRKGSGRKSKQPTATISFRVPKDSQTELKSLISAYIAYLTL